MTELCDRTGTELSAALRDGEISLGRPRGVGDRSPRGTRRSRGRVPHADTRGRARAGGGVRHVPRDRGAAIGRGRDATRTEGRPHDEGHPNDVRLEDPRRLRAALRRDGLDQAVGRRLRARRQDELRRVRDGLLERELGVRPRAQPLGPRDRAGRVERRQRGGGRERHGRVGARHRHRRLGAPARLAQRRRRAEADLRAHQPVRPDRVRLRRSTPSARSRGACATPRRCSA